MSQSELKLIGKSFTGERSFDRGIGLQAGAKSRARAAVFDKNVHESSLLFLPSSKTQTVLSPSTSNHSQRHFKVASVWHREHLNSGNLLKSAHKTGFVSKKGKLYIYSSYRLLRCLVKGCPGGKLHQPCNICAAAAAQSSLSNIVFVFPHERVLIKLRCQHMR